MLILTGDLMLRQHIFFIYIYDVTCYGHVWSMKLLNIIKYYDQTGLISYAHPRQSWEKLLLKSHGFSSRFLIPCCFCTAPAPGIGRQIKVNKSMAKFFHAGTLSSLYFLRADNTELPYYNQILIIGINYKAELQRSKCYVKRENHWSRWTQML